MSEKLVILSQADILLSSYNDHMVEKQVDHLRHHSSGVDENQITRKLIDETVRSPTEEGALPEELVTMTMQPEEPIRLRRPRRISFHSDDTSETIPPPRYIPRNKQTV